MTKKTIILLFLISLSVITYAQLKNAPKINVGIARRPELFELENDFFVPRYSKGYQFYGLSYMKPTALALELSQRLNRERWLVQFSNYFSYNYLVTPVDSFNRPKKDLKSFKYDCFIDVNYEIRFRKFKHSFIYVGAGIGRMNISKKFDYNYPTGELDNNGNIVFTRRSTSLSFWVPRISVGFEFRKISAFVTAHYTPDEDLDSNPSLWVEYKATYSFSLAKKKISKSNSTLSSNKYKLNPSVEIGIAYRPGVIELSELSRLPNLGQPYTTYAYSARKHFNNINLSIALQQYVLKKRISLQLASYFRYNHLYYGKNAQGVSSTKEKEYKRLKYDLFIDGLYHFKKTKSGIGIVLGAGIGIMNYGTRFKDSTWNSNNNYVEADRGFRFLAPRLIVGAGKNNFSFSAIAHGTPDTEYEGNPSIWLEFKAAYSFSPFKKKIVN